MAVPNSGAVRALSQELKSLKDEPLEGFRVRLVNDDNLFDWEVAIFGPPGTIYEGGYFKARMHFPSDYPFNPPTLKFDKTTMLYHPNVYESGDLCISILHPPVNDPHSGELPCERWNPTQNVRTILLSVVSLLNEPNTSSPANVDASVMYRRWKDSSGKDNQYEIFVKQQVAASRVEAEKDGIVVPVTLEDYVVKASDSSGTKSSVDISFYVDDDDDDYLDDNNDDQNSSDGSVAAEAENGGSADDHNVATTSPVAAPPANAHPPRSGGKKGGGENYEEITMSETDDKEIGADGSALHPKGPLKFSYKFHVDFE